MTILKLKVFEREKISLRLTALIIHVCEKAYLSLGVSE